MFMSTRIVRSRRRAIASYKGLAMQSMSGLSTWAEINPLLESMWKCQRE